MKKGPIRNRRRPPFKRPPAGSPPPGGNSGAGPNNSWNGCAETGLVKGTPQEQKKKKAENKLKNRNTAPATINPAITLAAMLAPGDDSGRWNTTDGAKIEGYVVKAVHGGKETCNCDSPDSKDWDIHVELAGDPADAAPNRENKRVIAEVTPRWRARLGQYGTLSALQALAAGLKKVRVTGCMFFDADHAAESENTKAPGKTVWRATAWEIHPITGFEVIG